MSFYGFSMGACSYCIVQSPSIHPSVSLVCPCQSG